MKPHRCQHESPQFDTNLLRLKKNNKKIPQEWMSLYSICKLHKTIWSLDRKIIQKPENLQPANFINGDSVEKNRIDQA